MDNLRLLSSVVAEDVNVLDVNYLCYVWALFVDSEDVVVLPGFLKNVA